MVWTVNRISVSTSPEKLPSPTTNIRKELEPLWPRPLSANSCPMIRTRLWNSKPGISQKFVTVWSVQVDPEIGHPGRQWMEQGRERKYHFGSYWHSLQLLGVVTARSAILGNAFTKEPGAALVPTWNRTGTNGTKILSKRNLPSIHSTKLINFVLGVNPIVFPVHFRFKSVKESV